MNPNFFGCVTQPSTRNGIPSVVSLNRYSDIDVINDEAIIKDNECVGYVTSGGYAHHVKKSLAFGYLPIHLTKKDTKLRIEINGKFYDAMIIDEPLYDPDGLKMRN